MAAVEEWETKTGRAAKQLINLEQRHPTSREFAKLMGIPYGTLANYINTNAVYFFEFANCVVVRAPNSLI